MIFRMPRPLSACSRKSGFESSPELEAHLKNHRPLSSYVITKRHIRRSQVKRKEQRAHVIPWGYHPLSRDAQVSDTLVRNGTGHLKLRSGLRVGVILTMRLFDKIT